MQENRLFKIVYYLLERGKSTAPELAERFEVSIRTIYRDLDAISAAGIPIYAIQGKGGGISLLQNYVLDKSILSDQEKEKILMALQGLIAIEDKKTDELLSKLGGLFQSKISNWIEVDFSDWVSNTHKQDTFNLIKEAIFNRRIFESGGVLVSQQWQIPSVEQHQIAVSLLAALLLWNLHMTHDAVGLQEPFAADSTLALLGRQQGEPAIGIFHAVALWRMFPQICKQSRIHIQIIVYLFPSRRRETADGGADSDCGFILDKRNGVDWPVDTGHIPHHLRSAETLPFAVCHSAALTDELTAGFCV